MRLSAGLSTVTGFPVREALPVVRRLGYEGVELAVPTLTREFARARDLRQTVSVLLEEHGLALAGLDVDDLRANEIHELGMLVPLLRKQMSRAVELGTNGVVIRGGLRRHQPLAMTATGLDMLLGTAEELNVQIHLANARGSPIEQLDDLRRLFAEMDHPHLSLMLDAGQYHDSVVNPRDVLREFGDRIRAVRVADRVGRRRVPLGEGELNVSAFVEHLREIGYTGWLTVDPHRADRDAALRYLRQGREYLAGLIGNGE